MQDSCRVSCWSSESGTSLRASWPGLSRLSMWFGASNVRERGKGESFVPAKLCCGPPHVDPVLKRCRRDSRDKPGHDGEGAL